MLNFEFCVFHDRQIRVAKWLDVSAAVGVQSEVQSCLELKLISPPHDLLGVILADDDGEQCLQGEFDHVN